MKRRLPRVVWIALTLLLFASGLAWYVLHGWVPTGGKALLIQQLEQRTPLRVSIGRMRYDPFHGAVADHVLVADRATGAPLAAIDHLQLRIGWLRVLLAKTWPFSGRATLAAPAPTELTFSGRFAQPTQELRVEFKTTEFALHDVTAPLDRFVPAPLTGGAIRVQAELRHQPGAPIEVTGRAAGQTLTWRATTWSASADVTAALRASRPAGASAWTYAIDAGVSRGSIAGLPVVGELREIRGALTVTPETVEITALDGQALGFPWRAEGTVALARPRAAELLITSTVDSATLVAALPAVSAQISASGVIDARAVCRGPLEPTVVPDCLADLALKSLEVQIPSRHTTARRVTGRAAYDLVARTLAIEDVTGELDGSPLRASGLVQLTPFALDVAARGTVPLETLAAWLPPSSPIASMNGFAQVDGRLRGPHPAWHATGRAEIRDAAVRMRAPDQAFSRISGELLAETDRLEIPRLAFTWREQPLTLRATAAPLREPRVTASLTMPSGELAVDGQLIADAFLLHDGRVSLERSRAQVRGRISRAPGGRSQLSAGGILQLEELDQIPLVSLPQLRRWELQGPVDVQLQYEGSLRDLQASSLVGRAHASRLFIKQLPVEDATCQFDHSARGLRIRLPSARIADGALQGEFALERRGASGAYFLLEADLADIQLARVADVMPSWNARQVDGAASGHALISGTWAAKPTWRGEGWVRAHGERLGDVPLLDRVFRGLFGVLGDRLGLDQLRRADIKDASVTWRLADERFTTADLTLAGYAGAEPITIYGNGSVGLDQSLDFTIEPELSEGVVLASPTTSGLAGTVLRAAGQLERLRRLIGRHRLTGTLKEPHYRFEVASQDALKDLGPAPVDLLNSLFDAVR